MRYRLLASYQGAPYEVGVGPTGSDVVLFAACPPPEDLQFEPATGHWRKPVSRAEVQALHESRPVGLFRGDRCVVLDDLGDRLHIAYLGHDALRAEQLGYWEVDRGVFELITPRQEVTDIVEQRLPFPPPPPPAVLGPGPDARQHSASQPPEAVPNGYAPLPPPETAQAANGGDYGYRQPPVPAGLAGISSGPATSAPAAPPPVTPAPAAPPPVTSAPAAPPPVTPAPAAPPPAHFAPGPAEVLLPPVPEPPLPVEAEARRASAARRGLKDPGDGVAGPLPDGGPPAQGALPLAGGQAQADPRPPVAAGPQPAPAASPQPQPSQAAIQPPAGTPPLSGAVGHAVASFGPPGQSGLSAAGHQQSISEPPRPPAGGPDTLPQAVPSWMPQRPVPSAAPPQPGDGPSPTSDGPAPDSRIAGTAVLPPRPDRLEAPVVPAAPGTPAERVSPAAPGTPPAAGPQPVPPPAPAPAPPQPAISAAPGDQIDPARPGPFGARTADAEPEPRLSAVSAPRRRRATRRRMPTQRIFSELAAQAAIPAGAYAIGEDVDGAMCLVRTEEGFEVFNSAGGARHEVRVFTDEESAYFYLFGVLVAEAVRTGDLAPRL